MINGFWNGSEDTWPGAGNIDLPNKIVFSNGAGHDVTPTNNDAFPIVAGKTDFAALLEKRSGGDRRTGRPDAGAMAARDRDGAGRQGHHLRRHHHRHAWSN